MEFIVPALITAGAVAGGQMITQRQAEKAAEKRQKKQIQAAQAAQAKQLGFETLAGEHWETLSKEQMILQSQAHQMNTLVDLISAEQEPAATQILTLPPAKTEAPLDRLNQAIDDLIRGFG